MNPLTLGLLLGGGGGFLKSLFDGGREKRERKYAAEVTRYSPWTGMTTPDVKSTDVFGNVLQGATTGALLGNAATQTPGGKGLDLNELWDSPSPDKHNLDIWSQMDPADKYNLNLRSSLYNNWPGMMRK